MFLDSLGELGGYIPFFLMQKQKAKSSIILE